METKHPTQTVAHFRSPIVNYKLSMWYKYMHTFISVGHQDAWHEFLLAVGAKGVPNHDLLLRQETLQLQSITPVKLHFSWGLYDRLEMDMQWSPDLHKFRA